MRGFQFSHKEGKTGPNNVQIPWLQWNEWKHECTCLCKYPEISWKNLKHLKTSWPVCFRPQNYTWHESPRGSRMLREGRVQSPASSYIDAAPCTKVHRETMFQLSPSLRTQHWTLLAAKTLPETMISYPFLRFCMSMLIIISSLGSESGFKMRDADNSQMASAHISDIYGTTKLVIIMVTCADKHGDHGVAWNGAVCTRKILN